MSSVSDPESEPGASSRPGGGTEGRPSRPASERRARPEDSGPGVGVPPEGEPPPVESAGFFPELLRRGLTLGFTGVFMTEEAVRRALGDSVPRDLIEFVVAQSDRTRAELLDRLSREFGRVLSSLDPAEVARRLLEGRTVEVEARFRLVPDPREEAKKQASRASASEEAHRDDDEEDGGGSRRPRGPC